MEYTQRFVILTPDGVTIVPSSYRPFTHGSAQRTAELLTATTGKQHVVEELLSIEEYTLGLHTPANGRVRGKGKASTGKKSGKVRSRSRA